MGDDKGYSYPKRRRASQLCVTKGRTMEIILAAEASLVDCGVKAVFSAIDATKKYISLQREPKRFEKR